MGKQAGEATPREALQNLLAMLQAIYWMHWTAHWQSRGPGSYEDHLLFQRLYEALPEEIDGLAEKLVAKYGAAIVNAATVQEKSWRLLEMWSGDQQPIATALTIERTFQKGLKEIYDLVDSAGDLTLGLDNFLQQLSDTHETHEFLLQQRLERPAK